MIGKNSELEGMKDWVDFDVALFSVGHALGVFKDRYENIPNIKAILWSSNPINDCLSSIITNLVQLGYLERDDSGTRFRINQNFKNGGNH